MHDPKKSKNYAVANGPVNRRTTAAAVAQTPVARSVLQRVSQAQAKHRLGTPLAQRVAASSAHAATSRGALPTATAIVQTVVGTDCATGLGLGAIQGSLLLLGLSATALAGVAVWASFSRRGHPPDAAAMGGAMVPDLADLEALAQLDVVMETMATQAPKATVDILTQLKESIVRCTALLGSTQTDAGCASEESLYLREAVRRYIPDSINSCLQVPQKDRASLVIDGNKPALGLLQDQLLMIQAQLHAREAKLTGFAGEALLRQQRFLAAKADGPL